MLTPLVVVLALAGGAWGFVADRIAARWPAHDDGSIRAIDWRTPIAVVTGAAALALVPIRFEGDKADETYSPRLHGLKVTARDRRWLPGAATHRPAG